MPTPAATARVEVAAYPSWVNIWAAASRISSRAVAPGVGEPRSGASGGGRSRSGSRSHRPTLPRAAWLGARLRSRGINNLYTSRMVAAATVCHSTGIQTHRRATCGDPSRAHRSWTVGLGVAVTSLVVAGCSSSSGSSAVKPTSSGTAPRSGRLARQRPLSPGRPTRCCTSLPAGPGSAAGPRRLLRRPGPAADDQPLRGPAAVQAGQADAELAADLATSWTASPDNKVFTLQLRQGVKFHDGTPFTSAAVKASFDRRAAVNQGPATWSGTSPR